MMMKQELEAMGRPRRRPRGGQGNGAHEFPSNVMVIKCEGRSCSPWRG